MRHPNTMTDALILPRQPKMNDDYQEEIKWLTEKIARHRSQKQQLIGANGCPDENRRGENEWRRISFALHDRRSVLKSRAMASCNDN